MVTAKTQYSLRDAREYFEEHLCVGDYYDEAQRVSGDWIGLGADRLGLSGKVRADDFLHLCKNLNPTTGERLTQRLNSTRTEGDEEVANRRVFYDFTFSPPKSVSLVAFIGSDDRIFAAHERAVRSALREFEAFAATRVRIGALDGDRLTRNFVGALFTHDTSRELDPHLHTHCIVFNATFDEVENRWKALQNHDLLRARKFARNAYYHELARELDSFGYRICKDTKVQTLERLDLTEAQKRDKRFYPPGAVIVFNRKVRQAEAGAYGKLGGILKSSVLVEVGGRFVTVSNRLLDRITVCVPREIPVAKGERLHLKSNRTLVSGARVTNGELVTVKSMRKDGGIELSDGRVLDAGFREFLPGYAITSYGSQGKTVDFVLFSDSTTKAATNAQQWYVTISRGRRGIRFFTPDKEQLRENVLRTGHRSLALELTPGYRPRNLLWDRLHGYLLRFGRRAADQFCRLKSIRRQHRRNIHKYEHKTT